MAAKLCIFIPFYDNGGVERMLVNLANGISAVGVDVDFIVCDVSRPYLSQLTSAVRLIHLKSELLENTVAYLCRETPDAVLCAKESSLELALNAKRKKDLKVSIYCRAVTNSSRQLQDKNFFSRWLRVRALKRYYAQVNGIVAVSEGVADDVRKLTSASNLDVRVANNPVITPSFFAQANEAMSHPWFGKGKPPVILGVGRFSRAKNFSLLLEAFALVRKKLDCRLLLLGEGRQRRSLEKQASHLGIVNDLDMPGFVENPYPYLKHSALFVLSSHWEGSPNVLTEAMALGTPVVSTDCPSGPREILQGGRFGGLVPVGDAGLLANAMTQNLAKPLAREILQSAVQSYTMENSAKQYLSALYFDV